MNIIEGQLPTTKTWRGLFLLADEKDIGRAWQLGLGLARAHNGYLLAAIFCHDASSEEVSRAREIVRYIHENTPEEVAGYICPLIIASPNFNKGLRQLVAEAHIDLLLTHLDGLVWHRLNRFSCAVAAVRGDRAFASGETAVPHPDRLQHIVLPTVGGPNTAHALQFLSWLSPRFKITALYVARSYLGPNEEELGRVRLRQLLHYVDARERIESKVVTADSVAEGIVAATKEYDLVVIGASKESSIDKLLFGDIPAAVVQKSKRPVMIVRQPRDVMGNLWVRISWHLQRLLPRLDLARRTEAYTRIRRGARPDIDYYMLISLATIIAALGLMVNSSAVVIGAMLVAPLMSPLVGLGLAVVLGDARFLRLSMGAVLKGTVLAIVFGVMAGLLVEAFNMPLTEEVLARTRPSLIDLGIALFSGLAAAYALSRSDAAGALPGVAIAAALVPPLAAVGITLASGNLVQSLGALLLFATNLVAISSATALMFIILGFRPTRPEKTRREVQKRSARIALVSLLAVAVLLVVSTYQLAHVQAREARVVEVARQQVEEVVGGELSEWAFTFTADETGKQLLEMDLVVRSVNPVGFSQVEQLQQAIGTTLQNENITGQIALRMSVIRVTKLDPLVPPTATPTPATAEIVPFTPATLLPP